MRCPVHAFRHPSPVTRSSASTSTSARDVRRRGRRPPARCSLGPSTRRRDCRRRSRPAGPFASFRNPHPEYTTREAIVLALPKLTAVQAVVLAIAPALLLLGGLTAGGLVDIGAAIAVGAMLLGACAWLLCSALPKQSAAASPPPASQSEVPQAFLECLPDPVILLNGAREIIAVNAAARDGLGIKLLGRDLALSLRHPDVLTAVETVFAELPSVSEEITLPAPLPRIFTLHAAELPASDDLRAPRVVLLLRDETRAKRAEQSRADFVANATHELRSPLSTLIGFIETLRGPASDDTTARERFLAIMETEARRMARLI